MSETIMIIIEHILDLITLCLSSYLLYRENTLSKLRVFLVFVFFLVFTVINYYFGFLVQPFHAVIVILSFMAIHEISLNRLFNGVILYMLMSSIQLYLYNLLMLWESEKILSYYNIIGNILMITLSFELYRLHSEFNIKKNNSFFLIFLLFAIFTEGMTMAIIKLLVKEYSIKLDFYDTSILTLSFPIIMILMLLYYRQVSERNYEVDRRLFLEKIIKSEQQHFEEQESIMRSLRKYKHDTKNYYDIISSLVNNNDLSELREFVENAKISLDNVDFQIYTGNTIGDIIINQKMRICKEQNIVFDYDGIIPTTHSLSNTELASLLSNIIDNAIEAAEKTESGYVKVVSRCDRKFLKITVTNSFCGKINIDSLKTTKIKADEHGFGINIIKSIVKKYEGEVFFSIVQQEFKIEVLLKL